MVRRPTAPSPTRVFPEENGAGAVRCARAVVAGTMGGLLAVLVVNCSGTAVAGAAQTESEYDGLSQATAAASRWEIKDRDPDARDGVYWLITPRLVSPQQF